MTRDWLLTLLAMSPYFLAATIVVLALIRKPALNEQGVIPMEQLRGRRSNVVGAIVAGVLIMFALAAVTLGASVLPAALAQDAAPTAPAQGESAVTIANFAFQPASLQIAAGTTVTWTNADSTAHTVTSDEGAFDAGPLAPGASFTQTFDIPGTYTYHCQIHHFMTGTIVVS
jgi:plastocyanin